MDFISFGVSILFLACFGFSSLAIRKAYDALEHQIRERIDRTTQKISPQTLFLIILALIIIVLGWRSFRLESIISFQALGSLAMISEFVHYRKKMIQAKIPLVYINFIAKHQSLMVLVFAIFNAFQTFLRVRNN
jgi:ammonia channel protein AmtB